MMDEGSSLEWLPENFKVCNCAGCGCLLAGQSMLGEILTQIPEDKRDEIPPTVAGRIHDRPYCSVCLVKGEKGT